MVINFNANKSNFNSLADKQATATAIGSGTQDKRIQQLLAQGKIGKAQDRFNTQMGGTAPVGVGANAANAAVQPNIQRAAPIQPNTNYKPMAPAQANTNRPTAPALDLTKEAMQGFLAQGLRDKVQNPQAPATTDAINAKYANVSQNRLMDYVDQNGDGIDDRYGTGPGANKTSNPNSGQGQQSNPYAVNAENTIQDTNINRQGDVGGQITQIGVGQSGQGAGGYEEGVRGIQDAANTLKGLGSQFAGALGQIQGQTGNTYGKTNQFSDEAFNFLKRAMTANPEANFLNKIESDRASNAALINQLYSPQGFYGEQYSNTANQAESDLANRGFYSSTSQDSTQAELARKFQQAKLADILANEQRAQDQYLAERERLGQTGVAAGNVAGDLGSLYGGLYSDLSGQGNELRNLMLQGGQAEGSLGKYLGDLGANFAQIGAGNIGTGTNAINDAINNYLSAYGLEGQLNMGQDILTNQLRQQILNNITQGRMNKQQQKMIEQMFPEIMQGGGGGGFLGIF
jgi:hypothetical protein